MRRTLAEITAHIDKSAWSDETRAAHAAACIAYDAEMSKDDDRPSLTNTEAGN